MKSLTEKSTIRVMKTLYEKGQLYASQLARELGITVRHLDRILPKLVQDSLVKCYKERGKKYCELTEKGEALVWALLNPDALTDLYKREETVRSIILNLQISEGAHKTVEVIKNMGLMSPLGNPTELAATITYIASILWSQKISRRTIAKMANISEERIEKIYRSILDHILFIVKI